MRRMLIEKEIDKKFAKVDKSIADLKAYVDEHIKPKYLHSIQIKYKSSNGVATANFQFVNNISTALMSIKAINDLYGVKEFPCSGQVFVGARTYHGATTRVYTHASDGGTLHVFYINPDNTSGDYESEFSFHDNYEIMDYVSDMK